MFASIPKDWNHVNHQILVNLTLERRKNLPDPKNPLLFFFGNHGKKSTNCFASKQTAPENLIRPPVPIVFLFFFPASHHPCKDLAAKLNRRRSFTGDRGWGATRRRSGSSAGSRARGTRRTWGLWRRGSRGTTEGRRAITSPSPTSPSPASPSSARSTW